LDERELAWAAGFFDGDGWAALVRQKRRRTGQPIAQINQADPDGVPEVLVRFRDAVGVGRIAGPKIEEGRQPLYSWVASSRGDVTRTGSLIGPWLSHQKRHQLTDAVGLRFTATPIDSRAWAAGLFDAEGSVSLCEHRSHAGYKIIDGAVTQGGADGVPMELERFHRLVGVGRNHGPYEQDGANEPVYRWRSQRVDGVRNAIHVLLPWLGAVKRRQALGALSVVDGQPTLPRGRVEWGSYKTHCVHGHEYATARMRPYVARGGGKRVRENHRCLTCLRLLARRRRDQTRVGDLPAADPEHGDDEATC
jgi:hypothetical protein